ncbi:hypothetical protein NL676_038936 [Syzygium grande]|nr:hypothetical protein NL676_038936 [Syzygium grande]
MDSLDGGRWWLAMLNGGDCKRDSAKGLRWLAFGSGWFGERLDSPETAWDCCPALSSRCRDKCQSSWLQRVRLESAVVTGDAGKCRRHRGGAKRSPALLVAASGLGFKGESLKVQRTRWHELVVTAARRVTGNFVGAMEVPGQIGARRELLRWPEISP